MNIGWETLEWLFTNIVPWVMLFCIFMIIVTSIWQAQWNEKGGKMNETNEGKKNDTGKLRWDLLPERPMEEVVYVYTIGANKYTSNNWRTGIKWGRIFAAMMRHAWAFWRGEDRDKEDGQLHLASVVWCALTLMEYSKTHPELDDRVKEREEKEKKVDWLDFSTDCGFSGCRAITHQVNHAFCRKHQKYYENKGEYKDV